MLSALLSGVNVKRDGSIRQWNCVEYYGYHKKTSNNETMLHVTEGKERKQINLSTFSGTIISHDDEFTFINGERVSKNLYYLPF